MNKPTFALAAVAILAAAQLALAQGPLNPPGPPAPTMKSLADLDAKAEKRTPISSLPFTISAPGSYYLTADLTGVAGENGITITTDHVTVDLNGFRLAGPGLSGIASASQQIRIRNGSVTGWSNSGILLSGESGLVEGIQAAGNATRGISVGSHSIVQSCTVRDSGASTTGVGIAASTGSLVSKCTVTGTTGNAATGIAAGNGSTVEDCVVRNNPGTSGAGISAGVGASVIRCEASQNNGRAAGIRLISTGKVLDCVASANTGSGTKGILAGDRVLVSGSNAVGNGGDGISVENDCVLLNNMVGSNANDGINVSGERNRIEGNTATGNGVTGIRATDQTSKNNLIIRNSAAGNTGFDFNIDAADNAAAPVVPKANVASNTNPHANFDFD